MSAPLRRTPEFMAACRKEAIRRAQDLPAALRRSNKDLAKIGDLSPAYVAQIVSAMRREYERRVDVSRETSTQQLEASLR